MTGFAERTVTSVDGIQLYYRDYAGPDPAAMAVVCLHGLTRNSRDFADVADHLAKRYRVICPDVRGRGKSGYAHNPLTYLPAVYVQDLLRVLKHAGVTRAVFIGTSMGGLLTMMLVGLHRAMVAGAVINDVGPEVDRAGLVRIGSYLGKGNIVQGWEAAAAEVKRLNGMAFPDFTDADWLDMAKRTYAEQTFGALKPDYDFGIAVPFAQGALPAVDLWPWFACFNGIPTLAIRGALSDLLSVEVFARMKAAVPDLRQVTVPNRGHAPTLSEPVALRAIDGLLESVPERVSPMQRLKLRVVGFVQKARLTAAAIRAQRAAKRAAKTASRQG